MFNFSVIKESYYKAIFLIDCSPKWILNSFGIKPLTTKRKMLLSRLDNVHFGIILTNLSKYVFTWWEGENCPYKYFVLLYNVFTSLLSD